MPIETADEQNIKFLAHCGGQTASNVFAPAMVNFFSKLFYFNFMPISC